MAERLPIGPGIALISVLAFSPALAQTTETEPDLGKRCSWQDVVLVERRTHSVESATLSREFMDLRVSEGTLHVLTACGEEVGLIFTGDAEVDVRDAGPMRGHRLHNTFVELPGTVVLDRFILWSSDGAVADLLAQAGPAEETAVPTAVRAVVAARQGPFRPKSDLWVPPPGRILYAPQPELGGVLIDFHAVSLKRKRKFESLEIRSQWLAYRWSPLAVTSTDEAGLWFQRRVGSTRGEAYSSFPKEATLAEAGSAFAEERIRVLWDLVDAQIGVLVADVSGPDRDLSRVDFNVVLRLRGRAGVSDTSVIPLVLTEGVRRSLGEQWGGLKFLGARMLPADGGDEIGLIADRVADALFVHLPEGMRLEPGAEIQVRIRYRGDVIEPTSLSSITPLGRWRWYPTLPVRDRHTTTIAVTAPKFWKIAATGKRIEELVSGKTKTVTSRTRRPVFRAGVQLLDGRLVATAPPGEGLPSLRVYIAPRTRGLDADIAQETFGHLRVLNDLFGPFPYDELEIVELGASGASDIPGLIYVPRFDSPPIRS
jgi:hypothetical protein